MRRLEDMRNMFKFFDHKNKTLKYDQNRALHNRLPYGVEYLKTNSIKERVCCTLNRGTYIDYNKLRAKVR